MHDRRNAGEVTKNSSDTYVYGVQIFNGLVTLLTITLNDIDYYSVEKWPTKY